MPLAPSLPEAALSLQFVRAGGPGGQHVNKASSAVQLRLDLARAELPAPVRERLAGQRANRAGEILIIADRFRSQHRNREDALARLNELLIRAWHRPKKRLPTMPTQAAKARRLASKALHGRKKQLRRPPEF